MGLGELTISPLDPHDLFLDPAGQGLEPVAQGWGVFEFNELRGVYATRELAEEMIEACQARWRQLPPSILDRLGGSGPAPAGTSTPKEPMQCTP